MKRLHERVGRTLAPRRMAVLLLTMAAVLAGSAPAWGQGDEYVGRQPPAQVSSGTDSHPTVQAPAQGGDLRPTLSVTGTNVVALFVMGLTMVVAGGVLVSASSQRPVGGRPPSGGRHAARRGWDEISLLSPAIAVAGAIAWWTTNQPDGPKLVGTDSFGLHLGDLPVLYFALVAVVLGRPWLGRAVKAVQGLVPGQ